MKKLGSLILTTSMIATNVLPIYANAKNNSVEEQLKEVAINTIERLNEEIYGADYIEEYDKTMQKLLENLADSQSFTYEIESNFKDYLDENVYLNYIFDYNNDGESILLNLDINSNNMFGNQNTSFYFDNEKILIEGIAENKLVLYFDDLENYEYFTPEQKSIINHLKYDNIKDTVNTVMEVIKGDRITEIKEDYQENLLNHLKKGDFAKSGNEITVKVDAELIENYFSQLAEKVENDENIKALIEDLGLEYETAITTIVSVINEFAYNVEPSLELKYIGIIEEGYFVKNVFEINVYDEVVACTIDFANPDDGLLSDSFFTMEFGGESLILNTKLTTTNEGRHIAAEMKINDETYYTYDFTTVMEGLTLTYNGETIVYTEPYFFYTEEPIIEEPKNYEEWLEWKLDDVVYILEYYEARKDEVDAIKINLKDEDTYLDAYSELYLYFKYQSFVYDEEIIDEETSLVLDKETFKNWLDEYEAEVVINIAEYKKQKMQLLAFGDEEYSEYTEFFEPGGFYYDYYESGLEEYNEYLKYLEAGSPKDVTKTILNGVESISEDEVDYEANTVVYLNEIESQNGTVKMNFGKSTSKNEVDASDAITFEEYYNEH